MYKFIKKSIPTIINSLGLKYIMALKSIWTLKQHFMDVIFMIINLDLINKAWAIFLHAVLFDLGLFSCLHSNN